MRRSSAPPSPFRARSTSCRSSSSLWAFCAAVAGRAAIVVSRGGGETKSHPEVEPEDSKVRFSLQEGCAGPRMLRTCVRTRAVKGIQAELDVRATGQVDEASL